jgi:hypothetical protein
MVHNLLTIQELDNPLKDDQLYPILGVDGTLKENKDETTIWQGKASSVQLMSKGTKGWKLRDVEVIVTNQRIVYICRKFKKGSMWFGGGTVGAPLAMIFTAASHAKAAQQRQGKVAIGQIRYGWPQGIIQETSAYDWGGGMISIMLADREGNFAIKLTMSKQACNAVVLLLIEQIARFRVKRDFDNNKALSKEDPKAVTALKGKVLEDLMKRDKSEVNGKMTRNSYVLANSSAIPEEV